MTWWCVTGRAILTLAVERKIRATPPLTHPTPIPDSRFPIPDSRFPIPDSRFPIPDSLFPVSGAISYVCCLNCPLSWSSLRNWAVSQSITTTSS
ncbi:hypothetical protein [Moorena sp. SIO3H5]|uniref:hypothetical protein n=1 Tax=Moorena sp. SIO3H5 TaxID=2607834 RepID=UPI0013B727AB|nr:hypothetical protein [Moorena sp. SIO3H5]NEO73764.1 hypothetical protein [Moorena sp. SIO3H5]